MRYESHDFYCLLCGHAGIPVVRQKDKLRGKFHRKKLYCPWCKEEINHVECRTQTEKDEFQAAFARGEFRDEAIASISAVKE